LEKSAQICAAYLLCEGIKVIGCELIEETTHLLEELVVFVDLGRRPGCSNPSGCTLLEWLELALRDRQL